MSTKGIKSSKYARSANQKRKINGALIVVLLLGLLILGVSAYFVLSGGGFSPWEPGAGGIEGVSLNKDMITF